jgi:hypothetical protein
VFDRTFQLLAKNGCSTWFPWQTGYGEHANGCLDIKIRKDWTLGYSEQAPDRAQAISPSTHAF